MVRLGASLALLVWAVGLASGLVAVLADLEGAMLAVLAWADLVVGAILVLLAVRLAMSGFSRWRGNLTTVLGSTLVGAFVGAVGGLAFTLGIFLPYLAGWGGHELDDFGGNDFTWQEWLSVWLRGLALVGAAVGAVCGLAAWVLRFVRLSWRVRGLPHQG